MPELAAGAVIVVDFGDRQLTFARVIRTSGRQHGIAFEHELVDDGNGGPCTSHRVSRYVLTTDGLPSPGDPEKNMGEGDGHAALQALAERLGLTLALGPERQAAPMNLLQPIRPAPPA